MNEAKTDKYSPNERERGEQLVIFVNKTSITRRYINTEASTAVTLPATITHSNISP